MPTIPDDLRNRLEKAVIAARDKAEDGARAALQRLYVDTADSKAIPAGFPESSRTLRVHLRAHARQLGDQVPEKGAQKIDRLVAACAYEFWHRMLFARFLAENNLLIHPESKVSISLEDCKEFGAEETPLTDGWTFASRCAARMLPQIFRPDDPLLQVPFAPEHKLALEQILVELPTDIFTADDSLGWVYQFWQTHRKKEINESEVKIGGDELPAVTQLFTEHYMVLFLLHNTLGAWWVGKQATDTRNPAAVTLPGYTFEYLRFRDDGTPAAGAFAGWPPEARELKVLDPCCGSGHFLVAAFELLARIRMHDEKLSARDSCDAVLRDNLYGLELDARCTQIAAFNLAFAAWKFPDAGGYRPLPQLHIACSGHAPKGKREDWLRLANGNKRLRFGMDLLYDLFEKANDLGSLIDPRAVKAAASMAGSFEELQPLLNEALHREEVRRDPDLSEAGVVAQGIAKAAEVLAEKYHLVVTNVPYVARGKQNDVLKEFSQSRFARAKADLATVFLARCLDYCGVDGTAGLVTPQNWLYQGAYKGLRKWLLDSNELNLIVRLGPAAFRDMNWWAAKTILLIVTNSPAPQDYLIASLDVSKPRIPSEKAELLRRNPVHTLLQANQLKNPDAVITTVDLEEQTFLRQFAHCYQGIGTADMNRFIIRFWELPDKTATWEFYQMSPEITLSVSGCHSLIRWEQGDGVLAHSPQARVCGQPAWEKLGIGIGVNNTLPRSDYRGQLFDCTVGVLIPRDTDHLPAIRAYVLSDIFYEEVRKIDEGLSVTESSFLKVPFDLAHWQAIAEANGPLTEPHSNDPTQWLFKGDVAAADAPHNLQVALARLLGYGWPDQPPDKLDRFADSNGIVCLPAIGIEKEAAERLRELLAAAYGADWSPTRQESLLAAVGFGGKTLHDWLRDGYFEQHCRLFHNRPFLWHIWDGRKDGFSVIVNYHKLNEPRLRDLIYHHLAEWIKRQGNAVDKGESGADARYAAALELQKKLKLIHEGEKPYDIFIRWKSVEEQPIGWEPDLNDGVRLNIRPFVEADILRKKVKILKPKDSGRDRESAPWFHLFKGDRINDHHLGLEEKRKARGQGGQA